MKTYVTTLACLLFALACTENRADGQLDFATVDLATPRDSNLVDSKKAADLTVRDLTLPPDLTPPADLTTPIDLTPPADLTGLDLTPPPPPKLTGQPCMEDSDCKNGTRSENRAKCLKTTKRTGLPDLIWDNGYCSMTGCLTENNDENGYNEECPGVRLADETRNNQVFNRAYCFPLAESSIMQTRRCFARCVASKECATIRGSTDYLCFGGLCQPKSLSECDPKVAGSCAPQTDGGVARTCLSTTVDDLGGSCYPSCDFFAATGCATGAGCYAQRFTGEGFCFATIGNPKAGSTCSAVNNCPSGYGCLNGKCWKYCNTANAATQCAVNGQQPGTCSKIPGIDLLPGLVGICSKSN